MLRSVSRSISSKRALSGLLGGAVLAAIAAGPVAAEDQFLGYTDIRLTGSTMPLDGWSSGGQEANFESGYRVSLMAMAPYV